MTQEQQQDCFSTELYKLIDRFTEDFDLTIPSVVGVMEVVKMELMLSCVGEVDDE